MRRWCNARGHSGPWLGQSRLPASARAPPPPVGPQLEPFPRGLVWETLGRAHLMPRLEVFWGKRGLNNTFRNNGGCQVFI